MLIRDRTLNTAGLAATLILVLLPGGAMAHGSGGTSHTGSPPHMGAMAPALMHASPTMAPMSSSQSLGTKRGGMTNMQGTAGDVSSTTTSPPLVPPNFAAACAGEVSVNCEATAQSRYTASNGDTVPLWSVPVPTAIPPTPPTDPISEPPGSTVQNFEQSGGGSGVVITEGGGPTLADCMALWEPAVHMTKQLWKNVCVRTMNGIDEPQVALDSIDPSSASSHHPKHVKHAARN